MVGFLLSAQAHAAATKVNQSDWWGGVSGFPSYVNMYIHVPTSLATTPPIVVAPHHCGGDGPTTFSEMSSLVSIANTNGFIMIFPEATGQNCWDAGTERSLNHSGKGDAPAIVQMVKYALGKYQGDAKRVYSVGGSSGGIMTEALLGVFPDVFAAGVSYMGVPCGCWAADYNDVTGKPSNGTGQWSGPCANGTVDKTAQQWGDLVRSYYPGYSGHRPRLQHWHGTTDTTLSYKNLAEDVQEWTNVLGLSETPTGSDTPKSGTTRQFWKNACGYTVYEAFALSGVGHSVPFDGNAVAAYFGLDQKTTTVDPEAAACGSGGSGNTGGAGGVPASTSRVAQAGNSPTATGGAGTGGTGVTIVASAGRSGGLGATGGQISSTSRSAGGSSTTSGALSLGGHVETATGGRVSVGGTSASGGRDSATTRETGVGGATQTTTSTVNTSGGSVTTSAATVGGSSATRSDTSSTVPAANTTSPDSETGCGCIVLGRASESGRGWLLVTLGLLAVRLRRQRTSTRTGRDSR
jgi:poly(hydroxyalkanoate) depolymerase family esterase